MKKFKTKDKITKEYLSLMGYNPIGIIDDFYIYEKTLQLENLLKKI